MNESPQEPDGGLHAAREEHDTDWSTDGRRRKVLGELGTHDTGGTVSRAHLAPHHTESGSLVTLTLDSLGAVHVHDTLAEVELDIVRILNTLNLDETGVGTLVGQSPPEASHDALNIEARASLLATSLGCCHLLLGSREELLNVLSRCLTLAALHLPTCVITTMCA